MARFIRPIVFLLSCLFAGYMIIDFGVSKAVTRDVIDVKRNIPVGENVIALPGWTDGINGELSESERETFNVLFIETSDRPYVNYRQACAIESVARLNPQLKVKLFMTNYEMPASLSKTDERLRQLTEKLPKFNSNIKILQLDVASLFRNTPLHSFYYSELWNKSNHKVVRRSDFIRLLLLKTMGGIYLDLDFIAVKPFLELPTNFIVKANSQTVCNGIMGFDKENLLLKLLIEKGPDAYNSTVYAATGPVLMTGTAKVFCNNTVQNLDAENCGDVSVLEPVTFLPIHWTQWKQAFLNKTDVAIDVNQTFAVHFSNRMSSGEPVFKGGLSLYDKLAENHCPGVYKFFPDVY